MRIRVIDLETTGEAPPDHGVCEIGWCDVTSNGTDLDGKPYDWTVGLPQSTLINPGRTIPPETAAIHHIIDADVRDAPLFRDVVPEVLQDPGIDAFAAHSAKFERLFITDDLTGGKKWICTYKCGLRIWKDAPLHSNQGLRYWRNPEGLDRQLAAVSHRAGPDAYVTAFHVRDMLNSGALVEHLIRRSEQPALQTTCHIGDHRGKKWEFVDIGFLEWLLKKDFDEDVKFTARHWIDEHHRRNTTDPLNQGTSNQ